MNSPPRKYPEIGLHAAVYRDLNRLLDYIRESAPTTGAGCEVKRTPNGSLIHVKPQAIAKAGATINQYLLKEVLNDYIRCHTWNGLTQGDIDIFIAKPFRLRRTPFDGQTLTFNSDGEIYTAQYTYSSSTRRVARINGAPENQLVIPRYQVDLDIIYAMECEDNLNLLSSNGGAITLIDQNLDARAWARQ